MSLILDIVRFGAACLVLLHHAAFEKFGTYIPWRFTQTGTEPVIAFFVLSGFVIAFTAEKNDATAYQYSVNRAARLLSVTIPAIILTVMLDYLGTAIFQNLYSDHWTDAATIANLHRSLSTQVLATASFTNEIWTLDVWPGTNSPFWSLGYEAVYYVIFGIAVYEKRAGPRVVGVAFVSLFVGPKVLLLLPVWLMGAGAWRVYKQVTITPVAGCAIFGISLLAYVAFIAGGAGSALDHGTQYLTAGLPQGFLGPSANFLPNYVSGLLFTGMLIGLKAFETMPVQGTILAFEKPIRAAAHCTFSMYLYHYPLIYFFRAAASIVDGRQDMNVRSWMNTAIVVGGTVLSIYFLARLTEQRKDYVRGAIVSLLGVFHSKLPS